MTIIVKDDPYIWAVNQEWQGDDMQWYWVREWYFSLFGKTYGPFATSSEAGEARDGMITDSYQEDD